MGVDLHEQRPRQVVVLQQVAELEQRGGVGHRLPGQVHADEVSQRLAVVQRIFERFVGQAAPMLQAVHPQPPRGADRLAADPVAGRVQRSMTAIRLAHGTMRSISPKNFSCRVRFFFIAYSALATLRCDMRTGDRMNISELQRKNARSRGERGLQRPAIILKCILVNGGVQSCV